MNPSDRRESPALSLSSDEVELALTPDPSVGERITHVLKTYARGGDRGLRVDSKRDRAQRYMQLMKHLGHSNCLNSPEAKECVLKVMGFMRAGGRDYL